MTVTLFTSPSCTSCRKAKKWLKAHEVDFVEQNIFVQAPSVKQIKWILQLTENGTEDIISKRSKDYQELTVDLDSLPVSELIKLITVYPGLLRRPILFDNKRLQVGFNEDEIRRFLPRHIRIMELEKALKAAGAD
ncbi:transcriptional regulator Spx [Secundilactobacillus folii]|uniref:Spx/MgsR family RNA polymerase-binding regulatory protein n=1 Tax=Secundilactobacillus folii TaxID=2678357 RepID=A0A7X3C427_9LACO|nr:transcriptional regulator Spx [Secundilactobacillus folii]MTV82934.1 Spx/MgsR family RNA polymerase-binding regulatory protein [Secundilactobacillus folii]